MTCSYFLNSHRPCVGGGKGSNSSNNGSESLNLENNNVNYPSFVPIETQSIDVKSFVDLACVNQPHGLKMMMSIENGKLILITGKNKGFLRELKHKIRGRDALSHRYKATLDWPDNNITFRKLWVDRQQRLCAEVFYDNKSHNVLLQLNPKQYDQNLMENKSQYSLPLSISINSLQQKNSEYNLSSGLFEIQLKSGEKADVTFDKPCGNSVKLNVGGSTSSIKLPISRDEKIIDVKPCGECLQVAVSKTGSKKKRILYINLTSFTLHGSCSPIISSSPPIAFAHNTNNNSEHFINANPFVGHKYLYIGNNFLPWNHWIDRGKHRVTRGLDKCRAGHKGAGIISFGKAFDPGLQSIFRFAKSRRRASKINEEVQCKQKELKKGIDETTTLLKYEKNDNGLMRAANVTTMRFPHAPLSKTNTSPSKTSVDPGELILQQIKLATEMLNQNDKLIVNAKPNEIDSWFNSQSKRIIYLKEKIEKLKEELNDEINFNKIENFLDLLLSKAGKSPIKYKKFDLLFAFLERTILNVHLFLSSQSIPGYDSALKKKLLHEAQDELTTAIKQQHFGLSDWRTAEKMCRHIGYSLNNKHHSLGKLWSRMDNSPKAETNIADQIAEQVKKMPQGDTLTLTTNEGVEGFAGVAKFGLPIVGEGLIGGWFAAVLATYEKEYNICLESLGNGETKLKFLRKKDKSITGLFGTGQGLEDLTQLVKYDKGSLVTFMPFEANLILKVMQESKRDFAFNIKNTHLSETLAYLLKIKSTGSKEPEVPKVEEWTDMQHESKLTKTIQLTGEFKCEVRAQNGLSGGPNVFWVLPRYYLGVALIGQMQYQQIVENTFGAENSFFVDTTLSQKSLGVTPLGGNTSMPIVIGNGYGSPLPLPAISQSYIDGAPVGLMRERSNILSMQHLPPNDVLPKLEELKTLSQNSQVSSTIKNRISSLIEIFTQASKQGYHQVEKCIAAQDIGKVKVKYKAKLSWKSRFNDNWRTWLHITPKHSTSLEQLLAGNPSSLCQLAAIRGSSQSQSQLENNGKASVVTAHLYYRIANISNLIERFTSETKAALENGNSKEIKVVMQRYMDILSRSNDCDRSNYLLNNISFKRTSYIREKPSGILPLITVSNYSQIELSEKLGEIEFNYDDSSKVQDKDILTTAPTSIRNKISPSLLSIPSEAYSGRYVKNS
ncbi:hypothetical protein [Vibrio aestuarianus]|uniref:Uncharacterized protein n=1 Tax=Vibrio aestuarianus TaxID=28171 RepID=A0A9X4ERW1_9VIBR|nr:hypothetical protein [Vibrio aestuarianus]MDE1241104.1 hypothetical protein [Vibrio aestuarianus]